MSKTHIFVAGHRGMVGRAIVRRLQKNSNNVILTADRSKLDLTNQIQVEKYFEENLIDQVYLAAAKVGGIFANSNYPAEFIYENLMIEANIIHACHQNEIQKLLFLGSSCIYPKFAHQPMRENTLLTGALEPTNEPYAIAKIAGIKLCESYNRQYKRDYRSVMPTNLYGPGDNYHGDNSHVIPALIRRFHEAKINELSEVEVWGTGTPMREFLYVDDMASASVFLMDLDQSLYKEITEPMMCHVNVGSGIDCTIKDLTENIAKIVGYEGNIQWNHDKPDGSPRKLMDNRILKKLGWEPQTKLEDGLRHTYSEFIKTF